MAEHNERGKHAEVLSADWLISQGYEILERNWRYRHAEIDLICSYSGLLIFVEVKFRSGTGFGYSEEFVDYNKRRLILQAAEEYIYKIGWQKDIRFDIVGVYKDKRETVRFKHFQDAFY